MTLDLRSNHEAFLRAQTAIPGGVSSPVRAYRSVGGDPTFVTRASGPFVYDVEGREYVDLVCSWGPALLGHAHPEVFGSESGFPISLNMRVTTLFPGPTMSPLSPNTHPSAIRMGIARSGGMVRRVLMGIGSACS